MRHLIVACIAVSIVALGNASSARADGTCTIYGQQVTVADEGDCAYQCHVAKAIDCPYVDHGGGVIQERYGTNVTSYTVCQDDADAFSKALQTANAKLVASTTAYTRPDQQRSGHMVAAIADGYKVIFAACGGWQEVEKENIPKNSAGHFCPFAGNCGRIKHDGDFSYVGFFEEARSVTAYVHNGSGEGLYSRVILVEVPK